MEAEAWLKTTNVNLAAAASLLGVPIRVDKSQDAKSGSKNLFIELNVNVPVAHGSSGGVITAGAMPLAHLVDLLKQGKLEQVDPTNPVLHGVRALWNRDRLCDWMKTGTRYRLVPALAAGCSHLLPGEETIEPGAALYKTGDLKVVSALVSFGVPLVRIEGSGQTHLFMLQDEGRIIAAPRTVAHTVVKAWREKQLPEEHPFFWAMQALINRERILDYLFKKTQMLYIRKPKTPLAALVPETASNEVMDKMRQHFRVV